MKNGSFGRSLMDESCGNYRRTARHGATAPLFVAALAALSLAACGKAKSAGLDVSEKAADKVRGAEFGSDEQIEKSDPLAAGLSGGDAMQGALATIKASAKTQGTQYEADARAMAEALATKALARL
jgi:hypothetical protein